MVVVVVVVVREGVRVKRWVMFTEGGFVVGVWPGRCELFSCRSQY